jgi:hypothetical protein
MPQESVSLIISLDQKDYDTFTISKSISFEAYYRGVKNTAYKYIQAMKYEDDQLKPIISVVG